MPKLNIYVDEELLKRVRTMNLPISEICQTALWSVVEEEEQTGCKDCPLSAAFLIKNDMGYFYVCKKHVGNYLDGVSTVRAL